MHYDRTTTTIQREWLSEIIAGSKKIESRQIKPHWMKRFAKVLKFSGVSGTLRELSEPS